MARPDTRQPWVFDLSARIFDLSARILDLSAGIADVWVGWRPVDSGIGQVST
jgi:hypothetical protein